MKENSLTKEEIRKYLENDEVIDSIDYLIELKNNEVHNSNTNLLKHIKTVIQQFYLCSFIVLRPIFVFYNLNKIVL